MVHAANVSPDTSANKVTLSASDSLLAVDEDQLVKALINMVHQQQQLKAQHNRHLPRMERFQQTPSLICRLVLLS